MSSANLPLPEFPRAKQCRFLHIECRAIFRLQSRAYVKEPDARMARAHHSTT